MFLENKLIYFYALFIKNKKLRKRWRNFSYYKSFKSKMNSLKWGVSYSVFDGEELLEASIKQIRNSVDYINVVYQKKSWYGDDCSENLLPILLKLKSEKLIDEIIEFKPIIGMNPHKQERLKRRKGLKAAKKAHVNYFMTMDCDEFYDKKEFDKAKLFIVKNSIDYSFVNVISYRKTPTERVLEPTKGFVQFLSKINKFSRLTRNNDVITLVDPTRTLSYWNFMLPNIKSYFLPDVEMHHMSLIRNNLEKKFVNSSIIQNRQLYKRKIKEKSEFYVTVQDKFHILDILNK